jgi:hypothetical protein
MRKILGIFLAGVMIVGAGGTALAATDTSTVNVTVAAIDVLQVTDGGTISLNQVSGNDITGDPDNTATLSYTHNFSTNRMITAQVLEGGMPAGTQDISLTVAVTGGAGEVTIVSGGTRNMNPLAVWNNIPRGGDQQCGGDVRRRLPPPPEPRPDPTPSRLHSPARTSPSRLITPIPSRGQHLSHLPVKGFRSHRALHAPASFDH